LGKLLEIGTFLALVKVQEKDRLVTVNHNDSVKKTIGLMLKKEYSQLPVVEKGKMVGVISYESLAKSGLCLTETGSNPLSKVRVKDCMEEIPKIFSNKDDLLCLLNILATKSYVLIGKKSKVTDIVTSYDALKFFRTCGEDFLMLNDIESILRKIIADKFDASSFVEASKSCLKRKPKTVNDMEFSEYSEFTIKKWGDFKDIIVDQEVFLGHLEKVRKIRNKVCHFNSPIDSPNRECLTTFLKWLKNKVKEEQAYTAESLACLSLQ
jgi:predicted transcriptional regulator